MDPENQVNGEHDGKDEVPAATQTQAAPSEPASESHSEAPPEAESVSSPDAMAEPTRDEEAVPEPPTRRGQAAPVLLSLEQLDEDDTFRVRPEGELKLLATDLARLGQLFPIDVREVGANVYQVICGFRRVAALRFLQRERVLARVHTGLSDEDALLMALAAAIHEKHVSTEELTSVRDELERQGMLSAAVRDMLEKAISPDDTLAPEGVEEEVDADELASDVTQRLGEINQDLALLADVFSSLDDEKKASLLEQLRYSSDLVAFLEGK